MGRPERLQFIHGPTEWVELPLGWVTWVTCGQRIIALLVSLKGCYFRDFLYNVENPRVKNGFNKNFSGRQTLNAPKE